jgi:tetratricopeptide (TPR) repeat protein
VGCASDNAIAVLWRSVRSSCMRTVSEGPALNKLLSELRRRRVFTTAGAYTAIAFLVLQGADLVLPALTLPEWTYRALVSLALAGLPVAVILSWIFQRTPQGIQRDASDAVLSPPPLSRTVAAGQVAVAGVVVLIWLTGVAFLVRGEKLELKRERVLVVAFENQTGRAELAPIGNMIADWTAQGILQVAGTQVLDRAQSAAAVRDSARARPMTAVELARSTGAGTLVKGAYYLHQDSIRIEASVIDAANGEVLRSIQPIVGSAHAPVDAINQVRDRILSAVAFSLNSAIRGNVALGNPPTFEAYQEFSAGQAARAQSRISEALAHYQKAAALDSTFSAAQVEIVQMYHDGAGSFTAGDSLAAWLLETRGERLTELQRVRLQRLRARFAGDNVAAARASERLLQLNGKSGLSLDYLRINKLRAALDNAKYADNPTSIWSTMARAEHLLGHHRRALKYARIFQDSSKSPANGLVEVAFHLGALGRIEELRTVTQEATLLSSSAVDVAPPTAPDVMRSAATELRRHGYPGEARELFNQAIAWYEARPTLERQTARWNYRFGQLQFVAGNYPAARPLLVAALTDSLGLGDGERRRRSINNIEGALGVIAAREGNRAEAERFIARLEDDRAELALGATTVVWLARIAAQLGQVDKAMALLQQSVARGANYDLFRPSNDDFGVFHSDPTLDPLRKSPAFTEFMRPKS